MLTFGQVQNSSVANIAGVNVTDPSFAQVVNDAVRQLMELGNWWGTVTAMKGIVCNGCITWPKKVDAVMALSVDNNWVRVSNYWYSFIPISGRFEGLTRNKNWVNGWGHGHHQESVMEISGEQPMFYPPTPSNPFAIQVTADNPADYGNTVTVYGLDSNGMEVSQLRVDGSIQAGEVVTLASVAPTTKTIFSYVSNVAKDITIGSVRAWQAAASQLKTLCAVWGPNQTSPMFLYSRLAVARGAWGVNFNQQGVGHGPYCIDALVKLGYEPVSQPSDILPLGNLDAIKEMVQAIKCQEDTDPAGQRSHEATAVHRLNMELRTRFPIDEIPIQMKAFGTAMPRRHGIGGIF